MAKIEYQDCSKLATYHTQEFHNRLKLLVKKLTCDVPKTREEFDGMLARYSDNKYKDDLLVILWKEMLQVIQAVEEAK